MLMLALKIDALQEEEGRLRERRAKPREDAEEAEDGRSYTASEFGLLETSVSKERDDLARHGGGYEIRRIVNGRMGLSISEDGEIADPLTELIAGGRRQPPLRHPPLDHPPQRKASPRTRDQARTQAKFLETCVDRACAALRSGRADPTGVRGSLSLQLLLLAILNDAAPPGTEASVEKILPACGRKREGDRSWVRLIGRLLVEVQSILKSRGPAEPGAPLDASRLEVLALCQFGAGLALGAARAERGLVEIVRPLETLTSALAKTVSMHAAGDRDAERRIASAMRRLSDKFSDLEVADTRRRRESSMAARA